MELSLPSQSCWDEHLPTHKLYWDTHSRNTHTQTHEHTHHYKHHHHQQNNSSKKETHTQTKSEIEKDQYRGREKETERIILCILERKNVCQDTRANQENDNHFDLLTVLWTSISLRFIWTNHTECFTMIGVVGELLFWPNMGYLGMSLISPVYSRSQLSVILIASLGGLPSLSIQKVVV